jgi:hypothetical protein
VAVPGPLAAIPQERVRAGGCAPGKSRPRSHRFCQAHIGASEAYRPRSRPVLLVVYVEWTADPSLPINGGCANLYVDGFGDPIDQPDLSGRAPGCTPNWQLLSETSVKGGEQLFVPTGLGIPSSHIALKIQDLTGVSGKWTVSDQYGETKGYAAIYFPIPGIGHLKCGYMDFTPAFGQQGCEFTFDYHPWSATEDGDTPDGLANVYIYVDSKGC